MIRHTPDQLRAADTDRDAVAERLATALSQGRLQVDEYHQRLEHAYAARTYADLDRLVADLPVPSRPGAVSPQRTSPKRVLPRSVARECARCIAGLPIECLIIAVVLTLAILA
jgi:hypothetical protein